MAEESPVLLVPSECKRFHARLPITGKQSAVTALSSSTSLSIRELKKAMQCGAVWLLRKNQKVRRIRKAKFPLLPGDIVDLYYDQAILQSSAEQPIVHTIFEEYSVWYKPPNILSQGSRYGDHLSLLRCAEKHLNMQNCLRLVHRLDREAGGLVILAHSRKAAATLSKQFAARNVGKRYWARVCGRVFPEGKTFEIETPLDNKPAHTIVSVGAYSVEDDTTEIQIDLRTGRYHQIRKHLCRIGHPLCGDKRYGSSTSKTFDRLQLCAWQLTITDPQTQKMLCFTLGQELLPF